MQEGERHTVGTYNALEEAIEKCEEIVIKSLNDLYEKGISPEKLSVSKANAEYPAGFAQIESRLPEAE